VAHRTKALSTKDLERVAVDTTVQPKNVAFPTDAPLMHKARESDPSIMAALADGAVTRSLDEFRGKPSRIGRA